jgi:hypothetical protein
LPVETQLAASLRAQFLLVWLVAAPNRKFCLRRID